MIREYLRALRPKRLWMNYFCKNVEHIGNARLEPFGHISYCLHPSSKIVLNSRLILNDDLPGKSNAETKLYLKEGAVLRVNGPFSFHYGADIKIFQNAELILDGGYCNINCLIRCRKRIHICEGVTIAHNVTIMDSDFHGPQGKEIDGEIYIGKNVWICNGAIILKGVTIGDGAVIGAGAVVTKDVPAHSLVCGCPATVKKENVVWQS